MSKLLHKIQEKHKKVKLVVFDLDGTLAPSKSEMDEEMAELIKKLLKKKMVAVVGGGKYEQFQKQFLSKIYRPGGEVGTVFCERENKKLCLLEPPQGELLSNLFLFPATSTSFYCYSNGAWREVYAEKLSKEQKKRIFEAFEKTFRESNYSHPEKVFGKLIEDRGTQVTFSALGQEASTRIKELWNKKHNIERLKMAEMLQKFLPGLEVRVGGLTSIDVTRQGIDKEYGVRQIKKRLGIDFNEMLFVGDALFPGGNDYAVLRTGVPCFEVKGPEETKNLIRNLVL